MFQQNKTLSNNRALSNYQLLARPIFFAFFFFDNIFWAFGPHFFGEFGFKWSLDLEGSTWLLFFVHFFALKVFQQKKF